MLRRLALPTALLVLAAACSGSNDGSDAGVYFQEASTITNSYESAAFGYFVEYREALEAATADTGEAIFVDANKLLFAGLAAEFGPAVAALGGVAPRRVSKPSMPPGWLQPGPSTRSSGAPTTSSPRSLRLRQRTPS